LGKGSSFNIYLPRIKKINYESTPEQEDLPLGKERILFVDDEASLTKVNSKILGYLGYQVTAKISSEEALELFKSNPDDFDLVISDMTMPNMTGDKLAIELIKIRSDIPVIICTGYSKKMTDTAALKIGIKTVAYKPIVKEDLAKIIRNVLDEVKMHK
jgi:CheY-like chemotaxis protein